jgi:hypothetical protein
LATFLRGSSALEGYVGWRFDDIEQILSDQPIDRFLAQCADPRWWTQTIAFAAVHARAPGG